MSFLAFAKTAKSDPVPRSKKLAPEAVKYFPKQGVYKAGWAVTPPQFRKRVALMEEARAGKKAPKSLKKAKKTTAQKAARDVGGRVYMGNRCGLYRKTKSGRKSYLREEQLSDDTRKMKRECKRLSGQDERYPFVEVFNQFQA